MQDCQTRITRLPALKAGRERGDDKKNRSHCPRMKLQTCRIMPTRCNLAGGQGAQGWAGEGGYPLGLEGQSLPFISAAKAGFPTVALAQVGLAKGKCGKSWGQERGDNCRALKANVFRLSPLPRLVYPP